MDNNEIKQRPEKIEGLSTLPAIAVEVDRLLEEYNRFDDDPGL